jgi:hypothetical protein
MRRITYLGERERGVLGETKGVAPGGRQGALILEPHGQEIESPHNGDHVEDRDDPLDAGNVEMLHSDPLRGGWNGKSGVAGTRVHENENHLHQAAEK